MYWQNAEGQHVDNPENLEEELTKKLQETGKQPDFVDNCHYRKSPPPVKRVVRSGL